MHFVYQIDKNLETQIFVQSTPKGPILSREKPCSQLFYLISMSNWTSSSFFFFFKVALATQAGNMVYKSWQTMRINGDKHVFNVCVYVLVKVKQRLTESSLYLLGTSSRKSLKLTLGSVAGPGLLACSRSVLQNQFCPGNCKGGNRRVVKLCLSSNHFVCAAERVINIQNVKSLNCKTIK